jgi:hemerythrin-like domain-containing protein
MSVTSKVRKATEAVARVFVPDEKDENDIDILDTLEKEHDAVKLLLADLQDADAATERLALVRKIKLLLVPHMEAEEKVVYEAVIALEDADAQIDGHEGRLEHEWASKTLERLEGMADATSAEHKAAAKVLMDLVEHHILEEESNIWSDLEENFSEEDRVRMNLEFQMAKKQVRVA